MEPNDETVVESLGFCIDEISQSKQLPLRQQREKPLLKYSTSEPGLVYMCQNNETTQHPYLGSAPNSPAKCNPQASHATPSRPFTPGQYTFVPNRDPYARPLSAKDIMTVGVDRVKTFGQSGNSTLHGTNISNNSIFRPNRPAEHVPVRQDANSRASSATSTDSHTYDQTMLKTKTKVVSVQSTCSTQTAKQKFEAVLAKPPAAPTHLKSERGARPPSALRNRPASSTIRNPNYSPSKAYSSSDTNDSDMIKLPSEQSIEQPYRSDDNLNSKITKAINLLNRVAVSSNSLSSVGLSQNNITNPSPASVISIQENYETVHHVSRDNSVSRVSSASDQSRESACSTPYYLKSSKPEQRIRGLSSAESRPQCEGRASKQRNEDVTNKDRTESKAESNADVEKTPPSISERTAGDGEADIDELDCEDDCEDDYDLEEDDLDAEDDGIDKLEDDELDDAEDDETISSTSASASSSSLRARSASLGRLRRRLDGSAVIRLKSARQRTHSSYTAHSGQQPALIKSLFTNIPPYINFVAEGEKVESLPWEFKKLLKWRMCSITPIIVKHMIARSGFRPTKKHYDWLGCWGKHMKAPGFKAIREYQKLNHFPGSFQIGRKDRLWRNLFKMQIQFGKKEFNFFPTTYVLPFDMKQLKRVWEDGNSKQKWIIKPPASARGIGIKVISKWNQIPKKRSVIVQKYLARPLLINESKFDCRIYVYVTSYDPLRIYVFEDGLVRFCSTKYSHSMKYINNKYMHLTNYSINKKNTDYESNGDDAVCQGHKWSLKSLWGYLLRQGVNTNEIWKNIKDLIVKTIICAEASVNSCIKSNVRSRYSVHELFGFDILLDETYKPWVLEVNISPSLHSNSQLDINIKGQMIKDLHNLAGFRIPDKADILPNPGAEYYKVDAPSNRYCMDKRLGMQTCSADEKAKHMYYCQKYDEENIVSTIVDTLTPDDLRILIESIDEDSRKGGFQRIFPTPSTHRYLRFFDSPRYYNLLLDQWCQKYNRIEAKGIALIESACKRKTHLQNPTTDPRHQWCPPTGRISASSTNLIGSSSSANFPRLRKNLPFDRRLSTSGRNSSSSHSHNILTPKTPS